MMRTTIVAALVALSPSVLAETCDPNLAPLPQQEGDETVTEPDAIFEGSCMTQAEGWTILAGGDAARDIGRSISSRSPKWGRIVRIDIRLANLNARGRLVCFEQPKGTEVGRELYDVTTSICKRYSGFTIYPPVAR